MALVLIGFMGAGKSTVAAELGQALGGRVLDSDALLEQRMGHSVAQEFAGAGEAGFRAREEQLVGELLGEAGTRDVVALGGGSVLSEVVRRALSGHLTVWLDVDMQRAWERVQASGETRPLASDHDAFARLHAERRELYAQLADATLPEATPPDATVPGGGATRATRALPALMALQDAPPGTRMLWASAVSGEYPVFVGRGLLDPSVLDRTGGIWPLDRGRSRAFCVTDETVGPFYLSKLGGLAGHLAIPAGEQHKTLAGAERVWRGLIEAGVTRADHVVALGGGVVGDLAGFCAATFQRGMPVVQVPTTLLAQVDSAYGGKTGVDLPEAKNYVGAYHQPAGVIVDPDALATLPASELAAGWVEVLKTALIAGGALWRRVGAGEEVDDATILACARTKLEVVAADERDSGRRQVLNLGHTVGHAIEAATGYARYRHGEAVGLGLLAALRLSEQPQLREDVAELLAQRGLPTAISPPVEVQPLLDALERDKKRVGEGVPFVLVRKPGVVEPGQPVAPAQLRAAIEELLS